jgi:hypothetical protein
MKKAYDPRSYLKMAEGSMAQRVVQACQDLGSAGKTLIVFLLPSIATKYYGMRKRICIG